MDGTLKDSQRLAKIKKVITKITKKSTRKAPNLKRKKNQLELFRMKTFHKKILN